MNWPIELIAAASSAVDFMAALGVLFLDRRRARDEFAPQPLGISRVLSALVVTSALFLAKMIALRPMGVGLFGSVSLAYYDLVIVMPLLGAIVLYAGRARTDEPRRRVSGPVRAIAMASLLLAPVGAYATFVEPFRLQLETASMTVSKAREGSAAIKIGVLADIQTTEVTDYERSAIDRLMAETPDLILIPGDVFQGPGADFERVLPGFRDLFARLSAPAGIYCVLGDVDGSHRLNRMFEGTPIQLLVNDVITVGLKDRRITICGTQLHHHVSPVPELVRELEAAPGNEDIRIIVAHRPDVAELLSQDSRVDLVVAGHTHGGQVALPFFGPPITLTSVPRHIAAGGLHELNRNAIYVSRGIGCERHQAPRIRFLCPPEISVISIE